MLIHNRTRSRLRLYLVASNWILCAALAGCVAKGPSECVRHPPRASDLEIDDYALIVADDPRRPFVGYYGRLLGWAFPAEADAARARALDDE